MNASDTAFNTHTTEAEMAKSIKSNQGKRKKPEGKNSPVVAIIMGSDSDWKVMQGAAEALSHFSVPFEARVISAHRSPDLLSDYSKKARNRGLRVIIAGAGGAAHLPGMVAAFSELPVIGVPVPVGPLQGEDALLSIVQMPKGVPVATVAIGGAFNGGLLAVQILGASGREELLDQIKEYKDGLSAVVEKLVLE